MESRDVIMTLAGGHTTHAMENFGLESYMLYDRSISKIKAMLWGKDDFRTIVLLNMEAGRDGNN